MCLHNYIQYFIQGLKEHFLVWMTTSEVQCVQQTPDLTEAQEIRSYSGNYVLDLNENQSGQGQQLETVSYLALNSFKTSHLHWSLLRSQAHDHFSSLPFHLPLRAL